MNISNLVNKVIPPSDYQHRNGFNNIPIIDKLLEDEKRLLEKALIQKLQSDAIKEIDTLIVETLAYLKSILSLPVLYNLLEICKVDILKLEIATAIFEINHDAKMIDIAINSFKEIDKIKDAYYVYEISGAFIYLAKFKNRKTKQLITEYASHPDYLISYNARQALEI